MQKLRDTVLFLPSDLVDGEVKYGVIEDACILSCSCIVSETVVSKLVICPVCNSESPELVGICSPLRDLYKQLVDFEQRLMEHRDTTKTIPTKTESETYSRGEVSSMDNLLPPITKKLEFFDIGGSAVEYQAFPTITKDESNYTKSMDTAPPYSTDIGDSRNGSDESGTIQTQSLMHLFHSIASRMNNTDEEDDEVNLITETKQINKKLPGEVEEEENYRILDNVSNTRTVPISQENISYSNLMTGNEIQSKLDFANNRNSLEHTNTGNSLMSVDEKSELYFVNCFPMYRKRYQFNTHSKFNIIKTKSKYFTNTAISPDCSMFAMISESKWEVYKINKTSHGIEAPILLCCGKSNGQYGPNFNELKKSSTKVKPQDNYFQQYYCKMSNDYLVISGSGNQFRVLSLQNRGEIIYVYKSSFPIRCIDIDPASKIIAYGITGKERNTGAEQALIAFHQIINNKVTSEPEFLTPVTITLPYKDPINTIQISNDGKYISCSTALESRFLIISVERPKEPRLLMKSLRTIDSSLESEGITDTKLFNGDPNIMCVTSAAFNSPPIVINTRINNKKNGVRTVAQPTMIMRLNELGSQIHKCEVSPRNDAIAFLDKNGSVYIMSTPAIMDNEKRRVALVDIVANSHRAYESASLRFSPEGHQLYLVDRKGILYVEDFAAGQPQDLDITRCKQIE